MLVAVAATMFSWFNFKTSRTEVQRSVDLARNAGALQIEGRTAKRVSRQLSGVHGVPLDSAAKNRTCKPTNTTAVAGSKFVVDGKGRRAFRTFSLTWAVVQVAVIRSSARITTATTLRRTVFGRPLSNKTATNVLADAANSSDGALRTRALPRRGSRALPGSYLSMELCRVLREART